MREPVDYIPRIRASYLAKGYGTYAWVKSADTPPWAPVTKPLAESKIALVGSGGVYRSGQVAFHYKDDASVRAIPSDTGAAELRATHFAYDLTDARRDPNCVFPLDPLRELVRQGELGGLGANAYAFMGGIYSARRVREDLAPEVVRRLQSDEVDLALFVPV